MWLAQRRKTGVRFTSVVGATIDLRVLQQFRHTVEDFDRYVEFWQPGKLFGGSILRDEVVFEGWPASIDTSAHVDKFVVVTVVT